MVVFEWTKKSKTVDACNCWKVLQRQLAYMNSVCIKKLEKMHFVFYVSCVSRHVLITINLLHGNLMSTIQLSTQQLETLSEECLAAGYSQI